MSDPGSWQFAWDRGEAEVQSLGAMLGPVQFRLDDGREVQPFAVAPWSDDRSAAHAALPPLLKRLRGEWPCVPFGMPEPPPNLPAGWLPERIETRGYGSHFHGYSSNADWTLVDLEPNGIELQLTYPEDHPVEQVSRTIRSVAGRARIEMEFVIVTRRAAQLPIGLHPVFSLPKVPGSAVLRFGAEARISTYPIAVEPGVSRLLPSVEDAPIRDVPTAEEGALDLSRLPLPFDTEELVLVTDHGGEAVLTLIDAGYSARLMWNPDDFVSCMLWLSNRGRSAYPWNGRFEAIGIEPVTAPFDLGTDAAANSDNPLSRRGIRTARSFEAGERWTTRYAIELSGL